MLKRLLMLMVLPLLVWPALALAQATPAAGRTLLVVGDSLSAEYGLKRGTGWVALLQQRLQNDGQTQQINPPWRVVNASISGDTTSGGLARLGPLLRAHKPELVVIELGGNDALRGLTVAQTQRNLAQMIEMAQAGKARVLLLGMQMPPNYGASFGAAFTAIYPALAKQYGAALVPFFLTGVADGPNSTALFQPDRIHPNEAAQPQLLNNVWPTLVRQLKAQARP